MPQFAAKKYLARRPTVITRIADYLAAHGAPPMVPHDPEPTSSSDSQETFVGGGAVPMGRKRRDSNASRRSSRSATSSTTGGAVGLPAHVELDKEGKAFEAVQTGFKLFRAMLGSASGGAWRVAKDQDGTRVWMRDREGEKQGEGLPVVKGEGEIEGVTTEQVLGTLMSESARRIWDPRIDSVQLVQLDNGFDQGVYLEANKGIFPTIKPFHHVVGTGVEREDAADSHGPLLVVSRSAKHEADSAPEDSTLAQCDFSGFSLAPAGPHSVHVTRLAQLALGSSARLNAATYKVLTTELALAPRRVGEFIDAYGFAPHFLRWGPGPAELLASSAPGDDIRTGRVTFRVGGGGRGTMREGKQVAWLEWSGKMYPRGLNLVVEPREAVAAVVKVETSAGQVLVQLEWSEKVRDQGATVRLERAQDGEGTEDVYLAGEFVDQTITAGVTGGGGGRGGAAAARARQRDVPSDEARDDETVAAAAGAGAAAGAAITAAGSAAAARSGSGASGALGGPSPPFLGKAREAGADGRNPTASSFASDSVAVAQTSGSRSSGAIPDNAMLILSKDLYFTQPQVLFMLVVVAAAYAWGKLA
ncbi:hypothetical protein Rhopal_005655-T1 [Rhodotorula paludigena]|uniref:START domain-containing protein n=1 Tax=Rhodotorula paludigena TaxID=86838 RepID=A0AAV5GRT8_9BASI|nr:hypothetical protein Rhopal_005655-T1 [Rhodotorula paludigena]